MKAIVFALAAAMVSAAPPGKVTSETTWDLRTARSPEISADGKTVVYVLGFNDKMTDRTYSNLWRVSIDGRDNRPLTQGNFRDSSPQWSPDGTRLAWLSDRSGKTQIHVRWMDSGQDAKITDVEQSPSNIAWSADGQWIAFNARVLARPDWQIKTPERPSGARWAEPPIIVTRLRWKADGSGLIRPGYSHIFIAPATGGTPRQITSGDFNHGAPEWSHDGRSILFSAVRSADADYTLDGAEIFSVAVDGGSVKQLTQRRGQDTAPRISPDGSRIAYAGYDFKHQSYSVTQLYVMNSDGSDTRPLTQKFDRDVSGHAWAPDSKGIYFLADGDGTTQVYYASLDGGVRSVTSGTHRLGFGGPGAAISGLSISRGGHTAVTRTTPSEPGDVVAFPLDQPSQITRLTRVNESLLVGRKLATVEELRYDSFDGRPIQGWIVKPPDFDASKKYPLILNIHGGPHSMYGVNYTQNFQIMAARGFVVLYTNPRGSTGYGEEFGNVIHTRYPGDDFKDLMTGVDVMLKRGYIDPKRMAVMGGSGGGLLTAWTVGHTDRFAAAVSLFPVANWITQVGAADAGYVHAALWMKTMPWENPQQYLDRSPIFFAKNFKTPTMIITGEADHRTPIAQSEELYFALKARRVPAVMVRIPNEPHGVSVRPSNRVASLEHTLAWIEKYTAAAGAVSSSGE